MTFPVIAGEVTSSTGTSAVTTFTCSLPASIAAGDLLIIVVTCTNTSATTITTPSGFTQLYNTVGSNNLRRGAAYYKVATGSEGSSISISFNLGSYANAVAMRITGYQGTPTVGTSATGTSTSPDPPNCNPGTSGDYLWLATAHSVATTNAAPTFTAPSTYTIVDQVQSGANVATLRTGTAAASLNATASSQNPGTYTVSPSGDWIANTIAVQGPAVTNYNQGVTISSTGTFSVSKKAGKNVSTSSTGTVSNIKSPQKTASITSTGTSTFIKAVAHIIPGISSTGSVALSAGRALLQTISIAATGTVSFVRQIGKIISPASTGSVTQGPRGIGKIVTRSSTGALTITKAIASLRSITTTGTASVIKLASKTITALTAGLVGLIVSAGRVVMIALTVIGTVSVRRQVLKVLAIGSTAAITFVKGITRTVSVTATGLVAIFWARFRFITTPNTGSNNITTSRSTGAQITSGSASGNQITTGVPGNTDITTPSSASKQITA